MLWLPRDLCKHQPKTRSAFSSFLSCSLKYRNSRNKSCFFAVTSDHQSKIRGQASPDRSADYLPECPSNYWTKQSYLVWRTLRNISHDSFVVATSISFFMSAITLIMLLSYLFFSFCKAIVKVSQLFLTIYGISFVKNKKSSDRNKCCGRKAVK